MKIKHDFMFWVMVLTGIVLGGLLGEFASGINGLAFLNYGKSIGVSAGAPMVIDLSVMKLVFGIEFRLTVAAIIGLLISIFIYKKVL